MTSGFKLRELAHTQDQAGIPDNLRAVGEQHRRPSKEDLESKKDEFLRLMRPWHNKRIPHDLMNELGFKIGYTSAGGFHHMMRMLRNEGRLRLVKKGVKGYGSIYAITNTVEPSYNPYNGEVKVDQQPELAAPTTAPSPSVNPNQPRLIKVVKDLAQEYLWDTLDYEHVTGIKNFINWMEKRQDNGQA